jgi:hypothetical protein
MGTNQGKGLIMKVENWPTAAVLIGGLALTAATLWFLAQAGWSAETIIAFGTLAVGLFTGQAVNARKVSRVDAKTDQQTAQLDQLVEQTRFAPGALTNVAETAATRAIVKYEGRHKGKVRPAVPPAQWPPDATR